jgi:hypothetical protein
MPAVGNSGKAGQFEIPENYETALRAGIRFYVCRFPKRGINNRTMFGFFDVKVGEQILTDQVNPHYNERWLTGSDANIVFQKQGKSQILIAFIPDDRWYHNKMMIAEHPWLILEGLYSNDQGMANSQEAIIEIQSVREITYTKAEIFKVLDSSGTEIDFFFEKPLAEKFIAQKVHRTTAAGFPYEAQPYLECSIEPWMYPVRKPEIVRLINEHRNEAYGWTNCPEFRNVWMPQIEALISEKKKNITSGVDVLSQPGALQSMVQDEVMKLIRAMTPEQIALIKATPRPAGPATSPETVPFTKSELAAKKLDELRTMAAEIGIEAGSMKKADLVDVIWTAQEAEGSTQPVAERAGAEAVAIN